MLKRIGTALANGWTIVVFATAMVLFLPLLLLGQLLPQLASAAWCSSVMRAWAFSFQLPLGLVRYQVLGPCPPAGPVVYVANHSSLMDTPAAMLATRGPVKPLTKAELGRVPLFGLVVRSTSVLVQRGSAESRKASMQAMRSLLQQGVSVLIFPEGHMGQGEELLPFHQGAWVLAAELQVPVVPLAIAGAHRVVQGARLSLRPGTIVVQRLPALQLPPQQAPAQAAQQCQQQLASALAQL